MMWLSLTDVTTKAASEELAWPVTGSAVSNVTDQVADQISDNLEDMAEQTNVFMRYLQNHIPNLISFAINVCIALLIFFVGKKLIKLVRKIVKRSLQRAEADIGVIQFLDAFIKFVLYFLLFVIIVGRFGVEASSMIALVGSAGLAVGLALQGSLSNFAGGVLLLLLKPFKVGDYIIAGEEGTVQEILIFYTKLMTPDNKLIFMPNGELANSNIINVTAQERRRLDLRVGISYASDLKKAKELLVRLLEDDKARLPDEEYMVFVDELGDCAVMLGLRVWVKTEDYWNEKWALTEQIKILFDENQIELPFPQLDVHVDSMQAGGVQ